MCDRYSSRLPPEHIRGLFRAVGGVPNYDVAPTQDAMVVRRHPETGVLRWGLIPYYEKDPKGGRKPTNARAETVATSGLFRGALERRRCLVPADTCVSGKSAWTARNSRMQLLARTGR